MQVCMCDKPFSLCPKLLTNRFGVLVNIGDTIHSSHESLYNHSSFKSLKNAHSNITPFISLHDLHICKSFPLLLGQKEKCILSLMLLKYQHLLFYSNS